ncbi:putative methyltransferase NSUN6 [Galendromus occidentalis]|uniref:Methyltransferase NSUN6 n=1 Tax=Galendromus occidentalis TaxID=34638 RepID=A0AAJ6QPS0_9ACAR|nr:putative methyltransferase NSUN6 [Galendromus occidentalis]
MKDAFKNCSVFRKQKDVADFLASQNAPGEFERLERWLAVPPQYTVLRVNTLRTTISDAKEKLRAYVDKCARSNGSYVVLEHPQLDDTLIVVSPKVPVSFAPCRRQLIVGLECGEAVLRGANVYIPGVLAAPGGLREGDMVAVYADVDQKCTRGLKRWYTGEKMFVGNGRAMVSRDEIFKNNVNSGIAVEVTQPIQQCPPLNRIHPEIMTLQNLPSVVCAKVLDPQPGQTVLDMCSAPGGKTTHLATLMKNTGTVIALDKAGARLEKTREKCELWNLTCVKCVVHDGTLPFSTNPDLADGPQTFDRILIDAPCSALGQRPRLQYRLNLRQVQSYPCVQRALLRAACELLKDDGYIVYSTCSINPAENEMVVSWAVNNLPLELVEQTPHLGSVGLRCEGLTDHQRKLLQRFDGAQEGDDFNVDTIGFFIAKFKKHIVQKEFVL